MPVSLLIVEDNEDILANIFDFLEPMGYELDCARNGKVALEMALSGSYECILLDILLPGMNGRDVCKKIRSESNIPIIMLTALDAEKDKIAGLDAGADDYLVKPFSLKELEARLRAVLRRSVPGRNENVLEYDVIRIIKNEHRAFRENRELRLSPTAYRILEELVRRSPGIVKREDLENLLWGEESRSSSALRNHIHELRREIDKPDVPSLLQTIPHIGYRIISQNK